MKVALFLGDGPDRGMGAQLCKRFAERGLHVVVSGRTENSLDDVVNSIEKAGGSASSIVADARNHCGLFRKFLEGFFLVVRQAS